MLVALPYAVIAAVTWVVFLTSACVQAPRQYFDSEVLIQISKQPWSWSHLFYPKPPFVPIVYRLLGSDPEAIVRLQTAVAIISWSVLAASFASALKPRTLRIAAVAVIALFALTPIRVGLTHVILTESLNDSLQALMIAIAVQLVDPSRHGRRRVAVLGGLFVLLGCAWVWTRDTNAVVVLAALPLLAILRRKLVVRARWAIAAAIVMLAMAVGALWSTNVIPPKTNLTVHDYMPEDFTARGTYSMFNNIFDRVLSDPEALEFFETRGLPQTPELATLGERNQSTYLDPQYAAARTWIARYSRSVYMKWLVQHPIDRVAELAKDLWSALGVRGMKVYMPEGWSRGSNLATKIIRSLPDHKLVIALLLLVLPIILWRSLHHPLSFLALILIASGILGVAASYFGDSIERARHCYGSGQQVIVGLLVAVFARVERARDEKASK